MPKKSTPNVVPLWNVYKYVTSIPPVGFTAPVRTRKLVETDMPYLLAMQALSRLPRNIVGNYYLEKSNPR